MKFRSNIRNREALAIDPRADVLDMLMAESVRPNEKLGDVCVVHVNGPMEHRACGYGDSYEQIRGRFQAALDEAPKAVVLRIDSPGGVVSGLNQFVAALIKAKEKAGIPVYAYADELIASAAYALACAADEIITPPSGIVGSIGVISLMADQVSADKKAGLNYVTITSGARKDDGHPHTPISEGAIAAETERVQELASQFFAIVEEARGFDPEPLEAGIFTGSEAVANGVADQVAGWDDLLSQIVLAHGASVVSTSGTSAHSGTTATAPSSPHGESSMLKLKALLATARAALKAAKTEAKRKALKADISAYTRSLASLEAAYKKTTKTETKEEKTDDEEDDKGEEESASEEPDGDEKESAEAPEKDEDESSEDESAESDDEDASAEDEEPKKDAKRAGKAAAVAAKLARADKLEAEVARLRAADLARTKSSAIQSALSARRITKAQASMLAGKKLAFVTEFLSMHKKPLYAVDGEELNGAAGADFSPSGINEQQMHQFRLAAAASNGKLSVDDLIKAYKTNSHTALNGAGKY